jgi:hypothetical protein
LQNKEYLYFINPYIGHLTFDLGQHPTANAADFIIIDDLLSIPKTIADDATEPSDGN